MGTDAGTGYFPGSPFMPWPSRIMVGGSPGGCLSALPASAPGRVTATPGSTVLHTGPVQDTSRTRALGSVNASLGLRLGARTLEKLWRHLRIPHKCLMLLLREQMGLSHGADKMFCRSPTRLSQTRRPERGHHVGPTPQARCENLSSPK